MNADLPLSGVPAYIKEKTGITRSRQAVYLWAQKGTKKGHKLQIETRAGQMFTTRAWVDEFLAVLDQRRA